MSPRMPSTAGTPLTFSASVRLAIPAAAVPPLRHALITTSRGPSGQALAIWAEDRSQVGCCGPGVNSSTACLPVCLVCPMKWTTWGARSTSLFRSAFQSGGLSTTSRWIRPG